MKEKVYTCEIKVYMPIDEVNLIERIAKKEKKAKGAIISQYLSDSPLWAKKLEAWKKTTEDIV